MAPAASTAVAPVGDGPGPGLVGSGGEERDEPQELVAQPDDPLQAGAFEPQVLAEHGGLLLGQLADLHLDARRERLDHGLPDG